MAYQYRGTIRDADTINELPPAPAGPIFDRAKCGTYAGYRQHQTQKVTPCEPCREAQRRYRREWTANRAGKEPQIRGVFVTHKCGTYAGYMTHLRYKITPCVPCKAAHNVYMTEYRNKRKAAPEEARKWEAA